MERYFEINEAGHNVRCKIYCNDPRDIRRAVVFCHGFGGHKDNTAAAGFAERMLSKYKRTALITFNLPCHGDDVKKKLCLTDCLAYLDMVARWVREKYHPEQLHCYATSFGGYLTLLYLARKGNPFDKIVLRCPAVDMYDVLTRAIVTPEALQELNRGREISAGFDRKILVSAGFLQELRENDIREYDYLDWAEDILLIHGTADEVVPFESTVSFSEDKLIDLIAVPNADHRFRHPGTMEHAVKAILEFYGL